MSAVPVPPRLATFCFGGSSQTLKARSCMSYRHADSTHSTIRLYCDSSAKLREKQGVEMRLNLRRISTYDHNKRVFGFQKAQDSLMKKGQVGLDILFNV